MSIPLSAIYVDSDLLMDSRYSLGNSQYRFSGLQLLSFPTWYMTMVSVATIFQFAFSALYSWGGVLCTGQLPEQIPAQAWLSLCYLGVMATTVALLFQNVGQIYSDPASAAVLLSLESVFGVLFSVLLYGDPVTPKLLLGFALIFLAVVCSETKFAFLRKRKTPPGPPEA